MPSRDSTVGPLSPERWQRVKAILQEALERPPAERAPFVARFCNESPELAAEVESLLAAHVEAEDFIETPALARAGVADLFDQAQPGAMRRGRMVGPYLLVREIGHGGMGAVFLASRADDEYRKQVAIKVVLSSVSAAFIQQRFRHERQILANLEHPNIARLIDGGSTEDGAPYFVMEFVDGVPIDRFVAANQLSVDRRLSLFREVCAAVDYAHRHLVVHRDLKPGNIIVTADGVPKLLDFGIAKLLESDATAPIEQTSTLMRAMSLESASPEQVRGGTVTTATDVYALGVLLYRLLTQRGPYDDVGTPHALARAICEEDPRRPSDVAASAVDVRLLRGDLDTIVLKAMQKDPARRYGTVEQFAADVGRYLAGRPVLARPDTMWYRSTKFVLRHKAGVAAAVLIVVSLVGGIVGTTREARAAREQRSRAERRFSDVRRLANSFLFEFHDAIAPLPGSTKARELVVKRAIEYLDGLSSESANDSSLVRELAAAYEKVGDVQGLPGAANLGDTAGALTSHARALRFRQALAAANAADASLQADLAATHRHIGSILVSTKDFRGALAHQRVALDIGNALLVRNPTGSAERNSIATSYHMIGEVMSELGDWNAALDNFRKETRIFEALLALDPGNRSAQRNVAIAYKKLGAVLEKNGDRAEALSNYRKAVALDEVRAGADVNNAQAQLDVSFDYASIGYTLSTMGDFGGSLANYQRALARREGVAAADPHDVNALDQVVRAHLSIGQVLRKADRNADAIQEFDRALPIVLNRNAADPGNLTVRDRLANIYGSLAGATASLAAAAESAGDEARRWRDARGWAQKALDIWEQRRAKETLSATNRDELAELNALMTKCDLELARLAASHRK